MTTTAKHQIKGGACTFSDLHASCLILVYCVLEPPQRQMVGLGRRSKGHIGKLRLYCLNHGLRPYIGGGNLETMG